VNLPLTTYIHIVLFFLIRLFIELRLVLYIAHELRFTKLCS